MTEEEDKGNVKIKREREREGVSKRRNGIKGLKGDGTVFIKQNFSVL